MVAKRVRLFVLSVYLHVRRERKELEVGGEGGTEEKGKTPISVIFGYISIISKPRT